MFVPHRKHTDGPPRPVTGDSFTLLCVDDVRTSQETTYAPQQTLTGMAFLVYIDGVRTSQETHL
jgi:hypothetical protein